MVAYSKVLNRQLGSSHKRTKIWLAKRSLIFKLSLLIANIFVVGAVGVIVFGSKTPSAIAKSNALSSATVSNPIDPVSSSDIASAVAKMTRLPETTAIVNQAQTADLQVTESMNTDNVVSKPNVIGTALKSKADIISYTTQAGDTVSGLAAKFGITSDSLRWSNDLTGNAIPAGKQLYISPVSNGIVYVVKEGDTPDNLAQKYHADKDKIVAFNDAELSGLTVGDRIVIPDGTVLSPAAASGFSTIGTGFAWGGDTAVYGGNGYDFGQCTWYAALRRQQAGNPVPSNLGNAITWVSLARKAGLSTGNVPRKGAVIWTPSSMLSGYYAQYGHVGFVEDVLPDGTVKVSDMNVKGWDVVSSRTLTPDQAGNYGYIY